MMPHIHLDSFLLLNITPCSLSELWHNACPPSDSRRYVYDKQNLNASFVFTGSSFESACSTFTGFGRILEQPSIFGPRKKDPDSPEDRWRYQRKISACRTSRAICNEQKRRDSIEEREH